MAHNSDTDRAMKAHANTYEGFKAMIVWAMCAIAVVLFGLLVFVYN